MSDSNQGSNSDFYRACIDAWIQTRMEKDRQLLTLSSLAIGLLMTFYDVLDSPLNFFLWLIASILFLGCIFITLMIFSQNAPYLEVAHRDDDASKAKCETLGKSLSFKSKALNLFFILGVVFTISLAISKADFVLIKNQTTKENVRDVKK